MACSVCHAGDHNSRTHARRVVGMPPGPTGLVAVVASADPLPVVAHDLAVTLLARVVVLRADLVRLEAMAPERVLGLVQAEKLMAYVEREIRRMV